jgi:hypothetical protein
MHIMLLSLFLAVSFSNERCLNLVNSQIVLTFDTTAPNFYMIFIGEVFGEDLCRWEVQFVVRQKIGLGAEIFGHSLSLLMFFKIASLANRFRRMDLFQQESYGVLNIPSLQIP